MYRARGAPAKRNRRSRGQSLEPRAPATKRLRDRRVLPTSRHRAYTAITAPLLAAALVLGLAVSASAKIVCPPGRFTMQSADARFDGTELVLGRGQVMLASGCASVRAGKYCRA